MTGDTARLFFAVWPAPEVQQVLGDIARGAQRECGGRAVPARNIHLTLVFLGNLPRERVTVLERIASMMRGHRFALTVDRLEYWRHNRILWAGPRETPAALAALAHALGERRPFAAHVTLVRRARHGRRLPPLEPLDWPVAGFSLVSSTLGPAGPSYEILERYPLLK